jgi:hypothetical protein
MWVLLLKSYEYSLVEGSRAEIKYLGILWPQIDESCIDKLYSVHD